MKLSGKHLAIHHERLPTQIACFHVEKPTGKTLSCITPLVGTEENECIEGTAATRD